MWNEAEARRWFGGTIATPIKEQMGFLMRSLTWLNQREVQWWDGREVPDAYRPLPSRPHECLEAAVNAVEAHPGLRPIAGYSFRPQEPERGIAHIFTIGSDGLPVDPAADRYGPAVGYLGVVLKVDELTMFRQLNGL